VRHCPTATRSSPFPRATHDHEADAALPSRVANSSPMCSRVWTTSAVAVLPAAHAEGRGRGVTLWRRCGPAFPTADDRRCGAAPNCRLLRRWSPAGVVVAELRVLVPQVPVQLGAGGEPQRALRTLMNFRRGHRAHLPLGLVFCTDAVPHQCGPSG
jgi:hypothetical protein